MSETCITIWYYSIFLSTVLVPESIFRNLIYWTINWIERVKIKRAKITNKYYLRTMYFESIFIFIIFFNSENIHFLAFADANTWIRANHANSMSSRDFDVTYCTENHTHTRIIFQIICIQRQKSNENRSRGRKNISSITLN